jgi:hypothetical protein
MAPASGRQSGSVVLVSVADDLVSHPVLAFVPVVPIQRSIDQRDEEQKRANEVNCFHEVTSRKIPRRESVQCLENAKKTSGSY